MQNIFDESALTELASSQGIPERVAPALARVRRMAPEWLLDQVQEAGLEGKGGARFPSYRKMRLHRLQEAPVKHLIVNGAEHEPGSSKDSWLLTHHPRVVVDGALCVAHEVGATDVHFAVNEINQDALQAIRTAVNDVRRTVVNLPNIHVNVVPDVYVVGEETALIKALEGMPPMPAGRPPFPIQSGLHGRSTLVHNAETMAHVPYIALAGSDMYRSMGPTGLGPTLCTFGEEFVRSGVRLVPQGISIQVLIDDFGGGLGSGRKIVAVQPGGPSSAFLSSADFHCTFDAPSLKAVGSSLGCAAVRAYADVEAVINDLKEIADFFAASSCGQCPPCGMQTRMLATIVGQLSAGKARRKAIDQIPLIVQANQGKGLCGLIQMPVSPIESLIRLFPDEVAERVM
ncbi:NADH-ubiquinone oxidoreductase-F iron-sulfur binding region domain-containing protein [Eoetvoesiella caeni]|nr:NADH-ubiquinone oxidoreductase-F iron-sulfur binding region domain-containing protein [Eoetvoesiella caeni]MCI2811272.1 hypothetical protein [Eoetvoesiella caeni]NYT57161.1 hypothetical protein [Eoetvoesiella caeni]